VPKQEDIEKEIKELKSKLLEARDFNTGITLVNRISELRSQLSIIEVLQAIA